MKTNSFRLLNIFILFFLLLGLLKTESAEAFSLTTNINRLGTEFEIFIDNDGQYNFENIQKEPNLFSKASSNFLGIPKGIFWQRIHLKNETAVESWNLELPPIPTDVIEYQAYSNGELVFKGRTGNLVPLEDRKDTSHILNIPFQLKSGRELTLILRTQSSFFPEARVKIVSNETFQKDQYWRLLRLSLYFGFVIALSLIGLFLWTQLRDATNFFYVGYVLTAAMQMYLFQGLGEITFRLGLHDAPSEILRSVAFLPLPFGIYFSIYFLGFNERLKNWKKPLLNIGHLTVFVSLLYTFSIIPIRYKHLYDLFAFVCFVPFLVAGAKECKFSAAARFFVVGWTGFFLGYLYYVLVSASVLPEGPIYDYVVVVSQGFEMACFSLGIANTMKRLTDEKVERIQLEKDLEKSEKKRLELLIKVAGGIAHEINNPLQIIQLNARKIQAILKKEIPLQTEASKSVSHISRVVERVAEIVNAFGLFAGLSSPEMSATDLQPIAQNAVKKALSVKPNVAEVSIDVPALKLMCQGDQIETLIKNLVENSLDAIARVADPDFVGRIAVKASSSESGTLIEISDNGPGYDVTQTDNLFEPFYTTKDIGSGTGLGLSVAKGIVKSHYGKISLEMSNGQTIAKVWLPTSNAKTELKQLAA